MPPVGDSRRVCKPSVRTEPLSGTCPRDECPCLSSPPRSRDKTRTPRIPQLDRAFPPWERSSRCRARRWRESPGTRNTSTHEMETFTLTEAAALTGVSREALRKRVNRGQLRSVLRDGIRRIPRGELERAGLPIGPPADQMTVIQELTRTIDAQAHELARLRALPAKIDAVRHAADTERQQRLRAEEKLAEATAWRTQLTRAGWRERRRLLRNARNTAGLSGSQAPIAGQSAIPSQ